MLKHINYKHLTSLLSSQPYFVWYKKPIDIEELSQDENLNSIWEFDFNDDENEELEYVQIIKSGYNMVDKFFEQQIKNNAKILNKNLYINYEKNIELSFKKTMDAMYDESIDWILNPVFIIDNIIAKPSLYRKDNKTLSSILYSSSTKVKNYIQAYFEINTIKKLNEQIKKKYSTNFSNKIIPIDEYSFFIYDKTSLYNDVPDLKFVETYYCDNTKNSSNSKTRKKSIDEKIGQTIINKINSGQISKKCFFDHSFDFYISKIIEAQNVTKTIELSENDISPWADNDYFYHLYPFDKLEIPHVSGTILKRKKLIEFLNDKNLLNKSISEIKILNLIVNKKNIIDKNEVKKRILKIKNNKCVWFDFEGFSLPFVTISYTKPHQPIIFQVSVIKTINDKIEFKENVVIDPKLFSINDYKKIIDTIYDCDYHEYIVFNKNYEVYRLNEINSLFSKTLSKEEYEIYSKKINHIVSNIFDLFDFFNQKSNKETPPIFLYELNGYSSIKKIENYITSHKIDLPLLIKPYKSLEIKNGLMASNQAIQRYLGSIGDIEWKSQEIKLAEYCENDVKAMIMVYHFINYLLEQDQLF